MIELIKRSLIIVYINHFMIMFIVKQYSLTFTDMNKLNLQLVQVFQYLFTLKLNVHHKSKNQNIVLNVLFQLLRNRFKYQLERENILNMLHADSTIKYLNRTIYVFAAFLIKMFSKFKTRLTSTIKENKK